MANFKTIGIWSSIALFAACFAFPAFYTGATHNPEVSYRLLLIGWAGLDVGHFSWLANIFYLLALIKYKKPKVSVIFSFLALVLALSFLSHKSVPTFTGVTSIAGYGYGYYLWVAAIGLMAMVQLLEMPFKGNSPKG